MIAYFDTSAVIPLLIDEAGSDRAADLWLGADRVLSSRVLYPEAHAALAQANRSRRITGRQLALTVAGLRLIVSQIDHVEITQQIAERAGTLAEKHHLRGYDAVHLAAAERVKHDELVLVAGDGDLLRGARGLDLHTAVVG
jgi:predicted nucleic acid-binding protein